MELDYAVMKQEAVELLQNLIRNKCINKERVDSGFEMRSVNTLIEYFKKYGINDYQVFEPAPDRGNLLVRLKGSDNAPSLMFESHLDVVPANADNWDVDPYSGEIIDDELWGRGTIDMLYYTATQAVAFAHLVKNGFKPRGDLVFLAVSDEEAGGKYGASWLVENKAEEIYADYMIGEFGGAIMKTPTGDKYSLMHAEKGMAWFEMLVRGEPGHASMPYKKDNAILTASLIINKIQNNLPRPYFYEGWSDFVKALGVGKVSRIMLTSKKLIPIALKSMYKKDEGMARAIHGLTHMTIAPTIIEGGNKINVITDEVVIKFDVRLLPGQNKDTVNNYLKDTLGDLMEKVEIINQGDEAGTSDPIDTIFTQSIQNVFSKMADNEIIPMMLPAVTDSRIFRKIGIKCYGFSILTDKITTKELSEYPHGDNERIPLDAIYKTTEFFSKLAIDFLTSV